MGDLIGKDDVWTSDVGKLRADLAAAQRELAAYKRSIIDARELAANPVDPHSDAYWIGFCMALRKVASRVAELLAQEGVPAQPQYREPTLEDAQALYSTMDDIGQQGGRFTDAIFHALKQLGFVRKVQP